ncbi:MAG: penicillin acylase family protein, partial [Candidatus Marinimicrobia bacterium]|nr:penicillin acylase family protein [Candidatus Neomarinimicrobiota bacterium]
LLRRVTQGRLAEIFGEDFVESDLLMRSLNMSQKSQQLLATLEDPQILSVLEDFCKGVNLYIESHREKLPPEFVLLGYTPDLWEPIHSANLIGYMAWDLTMPYLTEIILHKISKKLGNDYYQALLPDIGSQHAVVHEDLSNLGELFKKTSDQLESLGAVIFHGSNNWAVGPEKSVTGAPLFANDMHLGLSSPGIWYPMHHYVSGKLHVTGAALPGQPFIVAGHNEQIAWGMTNVMVDDMDFYLEKVSPENLEYYEYNGALEPFRVQKEKIFIKDSEPIEKTILFTRHGPVISHFKKTGDEVISMKWIGFEISHELEAVYALNRAENWQDFREAVKGFVAVSQNIAYADVDGNIGLQTCAGIPIRKKGDGAAVVPGWTSDYEWTGIVPFEELPYSYNPSHSMISSANNKTTYDDYPYHISYWYALHYRIDRIRELLNSKDKLSVQDFMAIQTDYKSLMVSDYLSMILQTIHHHKDKLTPLEESVFTLLNTWTGEMVHDEGAPAVFDHFYTRLVRNIFLDEMGDSLFTEYLQSTYLPRHAMEKIWKNGGGIWVDIITTEQTQETLSDIIWMTYQEVVTDLSSKLGKNVDKWEWGKIHTVTFSHPMGAVSILDNFFHLNRGPYPAPGSFHTVCPYGYSLTNPYSVNHSASQRHIYNLSDWDESFVVLPTGTSGIPASPFYLNQSEMYLRGEYRQDYFSPIKVKESARYIVTFTAK